VPNSKLIVVLLLGFGDSSLNVELHLWLFNVNETQQAQSEISREILRRFDKAGIEIPFPQQDVRLRHQNDALPIKLDGADAGEPRTK
jgi:small-conductance mechanosensitive channel